VSQHTYKKRAVPAAVRRAVALAAGAVPGRCTTASCVLCGAEGQITWWTRRDGTPSGWVHFSDLELDHVHPERLGGATTVDNLQLLCRPCNRRKGHRAAEVEAS
jgi:5-methylcytosine-specific restriction endonuclease McrA